MTGERKQIVISDNPLKPRIPLLLISIRDREGVLFEGSAHSVTAYNTKGEFDILPLHANFISLISEKVIIRTEGVAPQTVQLQTGILKVRSNIIEIYIGILH